MSNFKVFSKYLLCTLLFICCTNQLVHSASCNNNRSNTDDTQNFLYCCCRLVNLTISTILLPVNGSSNTTNITTTVAPTTATNITATTIMLNTTVMPNVTTAAYNITTASPNITTATPNVTTSSMLFSTTVDPTASAKCFYVRITIITYNECHCWKYRRQEEEYNTTHGNTTKVYKCFNVTKPLYIGGLFDTDSSNHLTLLPAAQMAVNDINNRSDILPLYKIVLLSNMSTTGLLNKGSRILLDYLYSGPPKVALLGPYSNEIAKTTAAITGLPRFEILQISYATDDVDLSEKRAVFPYFFRTRPNPDLLYNQARVNVLLLFKWYKVGLLYSTEPYYMKLNQLLVELLRKSGISIIAEASFGANPTAAIKSLKAQGAHVILGTYSYIHTNNVFCQAYCNDMWGPHYVWLLLGAVGFRATSQCTYQQIICAARTQFFFYRRIGRTTAANTGIGQTPSEFIAKFRRLNGTTTNSETHAKYTYDAMWAIADILHRTEQQLLPSLSLLDYKYGNHTITREIRKQTLRTSFYGASDIVEFGNDGNRRVIIDIYQKDLSGAGWSYRGNYDNARIVKLVLGGLIWTGGEPFRETVTKTTWRFVTYDLYVIYCVFAGLGILLALFCFVVMVWKRKTKKIYYSAVPINLIVITGCILVYVSVFLFGIDTSISPVLTVDKICKARVWVFCLGAAMIIGGLVSKLYIAYNVLVKRVLMKKRRRLVTMLMITIAVFLITLIILLCWHFINPHGRTIKYIKEQVKYLCNIQVLPESPFLIKITAIGQCTCDNAYVWYPIMIAWAALVIIMGCFYAYQTRSVYITALNDTKRSGICMYIIAVGCVAAIIIGFTTRLYPDIFFGLVGIIILIVVTAILIILYLNKVLQAFTWCTSCFSRCRNNNNGCCSSSGGLCCFNFCKGPCPRCFACCACLCAPFLACLGKLFGCCGKCCCGSGDSGSSSGAKQKFMVDGVGNDKDAELARLKKELDMKEKQLRRMRGKGLPPAYPVSTQTESPSDAGRKTPSNIKIFNQNPDYSHIKSKVDSRLDGKSVPEANTDDSYDPDRERLKKLLKEKDDEIEALKREKERKKAEEIELTPVVPKKDVSSSNVRIDVVDSDTDQDREVDTLLQELKTDDDDDDGNRVNTYAPRRRSSIQIYSQKPDWSHVRSKLKVTGAIAKDFGKSHATNETVVVNAPGSNKFKRMSSLSKLPLDNVVAPVEDTDRPSKFRSDLRRGSAPVLSVPSLVVSPRSGMEPLEEKINEEPDNKKSSPRKSPENKEKPSDSPRSDQTAKTTNDADSPRGDLPVRIVNGPKDVKNLKPKTDNLDASAQSPNARRGSNVKIINDPKDYSHIKSRIGGSSLKPEADTRRSSVQILNKPVDVSHVKSKLF